jgi:hypothetical protein
VATLVAVMVRSKLMPALRPETFGFAELNPVTEPVILPVPRLIAVWACKKLVSKRRAGKMTVILFIAGLDVKHG